AALDVHVALGEGRHVSDLRVRVPRRERQRRERAPWRACARAVMRTRVGRSLMKAATAALAAVALTAATRTAAQTAAGQNQIPRTGDGKPDLNGIWQAVNTANCDLEDHSGAPSPVLVTRAAGPRPPRVSAVQR